MAFCKNCGAQLENGAKFCPNCGTPAGATGGTTSETRKQVFVNSAIRKCPHCGTEISSDAIKCPECGFLLERENVNISLDEFVKKITSIFDNKQKREYIESYVLPNNKEAIRDFLNYAKGQRDKDYIDDETKIFWVDAWNNKCRQLVIQASNTFGDDSDFISFLRKFNDEIKMTSETNSVLKEQVQKEQKNTRERELRRQEQAEAYQRKEEKQKRAEEQRRRDEEFDESRSMFSKIFFPKLRSWQLKQAIVAIVGLIGFSVILGFLLLLPLNNENKRLKNLETEISQDIQNGNLDDAALKLEELTWSSAFDSSTEAPKWDKKREILQKQLELKQSQAKWENEKR